MRPSPSKRPSCARDHRTKPLTTQIAMRSRFASSASRVGRSIPSKFASVSTVALTQGTRTLLRLALPILHSIEAGGVLPVDELESSLHPTLAQEIVRQFNAPASNPRHAQLLFTTQDTNLLGTTLGALALRRDQVWLTEKDAQGATALYPLTDYKPR